MNLNLTGPRSRFQLSFHAAYLVRQVSQILLAQLHRVPEDVIEELEGAGTVHHQGDLAKEWVVGEAALVADLVGEVETRIAQSRGLEVFRGQGLHTPGRGLLQGLVLGRHTGLAGVEVGVGGV